MYVISFYYNANKSQYFKLLINQFLGLNAIQLTITKLTY